MLVSAHKTSKLSLMFTIIADEYVVSVFPLDEAGEPNTYMEEYFRAFDDSASAVQAYVRLEGALDYIERTGDDPVRVMAEARRRIRDALYPEA